MERGRHSSAGGKGGVGHRWRASAQAARWRRAAPRLAGQQRRAQRCAAAASHNEPVRVERKAAAHHTRGALRRSAALCLLAQQLPPMEGSLSVDDCRSCRSTRHNLPGASGALTTNSQEPTRTNSQPQTNLSQCMNLSHLTSRAPLHAPALLCTRFVGSARTPCWATAFLCFCLFFMLAPAFAMVPCSPSLHQILLRNGAACKQTDAAFT